MTVKRIVPNLPMANASESQRFYQTVLGLNLVMDLGWIKTFSVGSEDSAELEGHSNNGSNSNSGPQLSILSQDTSGLPVPEVSVEVDDVDGVYEKAVTAGYEIVYEIVDEPWGVRRFFVREPGGKVLNILAHRAAN